MKNEIVSRAMSVVVFMILFAVLGAVIQAWGNARYNGERLKEISYLETVSMVEYLDLKLSAKMVDDESFQVSFSRNAPYDIAGEQEQTLKMFCNGFPKLLRKRVPIIISMDKGRSDVLLTYKLSEWGGDKLPDNLEGCELNVTRRYVFVLNYNIERTVELKATFGF